MRRTEASVTDITATAVAPVRDLDPTTCSCRVACGRCGWEEASACRIDPPVQAVRIGRAQGYKGWLSRENPAGPIQWFRDGLVPRPPQPPRAARRAQVVPLDHEHHRTGDVDEQGRRLVLDGCQRGVSCGHRNGARLWVPRLQRGSAGEGEQGGAPVTAGHKYGSHVAGLVVSQALARRTPPRRGARPPGPAAGRPAAERAPRRGPPHRPVRRSYAASAAARLGVDLSHVAGEAGIRDRTHPAIVSDRSVFWTHAPARSPSTAPPGRLSRSCSRSSARR